MRRKSSLAFFFLWTAPLAAAAAPPTPKPANPASDNKAAPSAAQATPYTGHGAASVSPEILARYAPPALPQDTTAHIQAMLDVRAPGPGVLHPSGKPLFFTWAVTGTKQVWRVDAPLAFPVQMTGGEDQTQIVDVAPDGSFILISRDRKGEENPGLYLQSPQGGALEPIQHKKGVQTLAQFISDDSRYVYYKANDVKADNYVIYRYDRSAKAAEKIFAEEGLWDIADHRPDGRLLLAKEVGSNMKEFYEWSPKTKALTALFGQGEREDYRAMYGAKDGEVIAQTPKLGDFRRLYVWRVGAALTPITPEMKHDVSSFAIDDARQRIYYTINADGYTRLRALDAKTLKETALPAIPEADHVKLGAASHDGRYATLIVETAKAPPMSYVLDWRTKKLTQWHAPSAPEIDTAGFAVAALEWYPARDGASIPMFVRRPKTCATKPCPVLVDFHGGPEAQVHPGFNVYAQIFVDAGFVLVQPNVRGSDGYGKAWIHADDGAKRLTVITDIEDCAKHIREKWTESGRAPKIGIMGGSYGGYSTLIGMTMFAGAYDAGAAVVGMSNLVTFLQNTAPYRRALRASEYGDPVKDHDALVKLSPITYIDRVKAPLLVIQGASDPRVPVGEAIQIHDALVAKKIATQLVIFGDEGHGAQKRENRALQIGHMLRFFKAQLLDPAKNVQAAK